MRAGLTPRMRDCYDAIVAHIARHKCSPSIDELRIALRLTSKGCVVMLIRALTERGWITYRPYSVRSIAIVAPAYTLPPAIEAALQRHCAASGESATDIVADAVALFLDLGDVVEAAA